MIVIFLIVLFCFLFFMQSFAYMTYPPSSNGDWHIVGITERNMTMIDTVEYFCIDIIFGCSESFSVTILRQAKKTIP